MSVTTKISVVVLHENSEQRLNSTVHSILSQNTETVPEIILVNSSGSEEFARYARSLTDFPWMKSLKVYGRDSAKNLPNIVSRASGEFVIVLKGGDFLFPEALRQMSAFLESNNLDLVLAAAGRKTSLGSMAEDSQVDSLFQLSPLQTLEFPEGSAVSPAVYLLRPIRSQVKLFRKSLIKGSSRKFELGILHEYVCEKASKSKLPREISLLETKFLPPTEEERSDLEAVPKDERQVWLFAERRGQSAEENGWVFFKYCVKNAVDADCYFVLGKDAPEPAEPGYEDRIIRKGGLRWLVLIGQASHFFFTDEIADILNTTSDWENYPDAKYIYLTHGTLAYSAGVYQNTHTYIDMVTCASEADIATASVQWNFPKSSFAVTGLARWDQLKSSATGREILFSPTWRKSLPTNDWSKLSDQNDDDVEKFKQSLYYDRISNFLKSPRLTELLNEYSATLTAALHFRVRGLFANSLSSGSGPIRVYDPKADLRNFQGILNDSSLLITDYSSVMWDMAFMEKPSILYQFDKAAMLNERTLTSFNIPEIGRVFDVCYREDDLLDTLAVNFEKTFELTASRRRAIKEFIPFQDARNCARILDAVEREQFRPQAPKTPSLPTEGSILDLAALQGQLTHKKVAAVVSDYLATALPTEVSRLNPEDWETSLHTISPDVLLIEPNLDGRGPWSEIFFDVEKANEFVVRATDLMEQIGGDICVIENPFQPRSLQMKKGKETSEVLVQVPYNLPKKREGIDISVVVPIYNSAEFLEDCLQSLIKQDFGGTYEIIAVDDGSVDKSPEIIEKIARTYANFRVVRQPNARQGIARNYGVHVASGEYVTFVDADDILTSSALSDLYHSARLNDAQVSVGLYSSYNVETKASFINQSGYHFWLGPNVLNAERWAPVLQECSSVGKLIRRDFLLENDIWFSASFHEDEVFTTLLFSAADKIAVCKEIVYIYYARQNDSGTRTFSHEKLRQIMLVGMFLADVMKERGVSDAIYKFKMQHLLRRYDRFMLKMDVSKQDKQLGKAVPKQAQGMLAVLRNEKLTGLLGRLLQKIDNEDILYSAVSFGPGLLLLKYGEISKAIDFYSGRSDAGKVFLSEKELVSADEIDQSELTYSHASQYNYYARERVIQTTLEEEDKLVMVPDGGLRYQIGDLFVSTAKSPLRKIFKLPGELIKLYRTVR